MSIVDQLSQLRREKYPNLLPAGVPEEFEKDQIQYFCSKYPDIANDATKIEKFFQFCLHSIAESWYRTDAVRHWVDIYAKYPNTVDIFLKDGFAKKLGIYPENLRIITNRGLSLKTDSPEKSWTYAPTGETDLQSQVPLKGPANYSYKQILDPDSSGLEVSETGIRVSSNERSPFIELDYAKEVTRLYKEIQEETPGALVLRESQAQMIFDMIIKNGSHFHLYTRDPAEYSFSQKICFPLGQNQIEKLKKCMNKLNAQDLFDEVMGADFYAQLQLLLKDKARLLEQAKKSLDPEDFEKAIASLDSKFIRENFQSIYKLVASSLETIHLILQMEEKKTLSEPELGTTFKKDPESTTAAIQELLKLCFTVLHPCTTHVFEAEQKTFLVKYVHGTIEYIPIKWLKKTLNHLLILFIGYRRKYYYEAKDHETQASQWKTARYINVKGTLESYQTMGTKTPLASKTISKFRTAR